MTFDEAGIAGRVAVCRLSGGVHLRYDPVDGSVRCLPYPAGAPEGRAGGATRAAGGSARHGPPRECEALDEARPLHLAPL